MFVPKDLPPELREILNNAIGSKEFTDAAVASGYCGYTSPHRSQAGGTCNATCLESKGHAGSHQCFYGDAF
jgi:hypothetical protein